ncbi:MAG: uroporphyrinogen-III synthase [Micrococcales bacterium]|nr:uroporphyrinogen-III synthase [Micrococcales bacterium]
MPAAQGVPVEQSRPVEHGALAGRVVLVAGSARTTHRAADLLGTAGATPAPLVVIATEAVRSAEVDAALADLAAGRYGWLTLTSAAAWEALRPDAGEADEAAALAADPLQTPGSGHVDLGGARVAVVGPGTAEAVRADGVEPLVPDPAGGAVELVPPLAEAAAGTRVLVVRGDLARPTLVDGLRAAGTAVDEVVVYRTVRVTGDRGSRTMPSVDDVVVTSPSAVDGLLAALGAPPARVRVVCLGPTTAEAAEAAGLRVDLVGTSSLVGLVDLLASSLADPAQPSPSPEILSSRPPAPEEASPPGEAP